MATMRAETVAARQRFFGPDAVDPDSGAVRADRVIVSWLGCATFAVAMAGEVFLLDAWVPRGLHSNYVPTTPREVAALAPSAIFIGHGHFDHAADAPALAHATGAIVYGTAAHCARIQRKPAGPGPLVCVELGDADARPGDRYDHTVAPGIEMTAVRHLHSAPTAPHRGPDRSPRLLPAPGPRDILSFPPRLRDAAELAGSLAHPEGGSLLYQFRVGDFGLAWHDSSGPLSDRAPGVLAVLRELPRSDVEIGAIQGFNQFANGLRDPRGYIEALRPSVFVPCHHDNWLPVLTTRGHRYHRPLRAELDRVAVPARPRLSFLSDPDDYLRPHRLTFVL
jgi:L-ascorbate metabolism protein UlaG (beta-lactamase superfamily)